jgi:hypothetical protein
VRYLAAGWVTPPPPSIPPPCEPHPVNPKPADTTETATASVAAARLSDFELMYVRIFSSFSLVID